MCIYIYIYIHYIYIYNVNNNINDNNNDNDNIEREISQEEEPALKRRCVRQPGPAANNNINSKTMIIVLI